MEKPSFFKMFDSYIETIRSCETHKDRSMLVLAMFDFWETGIAPDIPKKLQDKWRFIYQFMSISRTKAYAALERNGEKNEENTTKSAENTLGFQKKTNNTRSDSQQVSNSLCAQTSHNVSTNRIENKEKKNIEKDSTIGIEDRTIDDRIARMGMTTSTNEMDEFYEALEIVHHQSGQESNPLSQSSSTQSNPPMAQWGMVGYPDGSIDWGDVHKALHHQSDQESSPISNPNPCSSSNPCSCLDTTQSKTTGNPGQSKKYTDDELDAAGAKILERIVTLYREQRRAVPYTKTKASEELGLDSTLFYKAINRLEATNQLHKEKVKLKDGNEINSFTPMAVPSTHQQKVLSSNYRPDYNSTPPVYTHYSMYYKNAPFFYDASWDKETFMKRNTCVIDNAWEVGLAGIASSKNSLANGLWNVVTDAATRGLLVDAK